MSQRLVLYFSTRCLTLRFKRKREAECLRYSKKYLQYRLRPLRIRAKLKAAQISLFCTQNLHIQVTYYQSHVGVCIRADCFENTFCTHPSESCLARVYLSKMYACQHVQ